MFRWSPSLLLQTVETVFFFHPTLVVSVKIYGKSTAQIKVRYQVERGIVCMAKSVKTERMAEYIDLVDFSLSEEDMAAIVQFDMKESFFNHQDGSTVDISKLSYLHKNK